MKLVTISDKTNNTPSIVMSKDDLINITPEQKEQLASMTTKEFADFVESSIISNI